MKRGDIVIASGKGDFSGKPRPVLIVQRTLTLGAGLSVIVCPFTTTLHEGAFRVRVEPDSANGLKETAEVMCDKISTIRIDRIGQKIGEFNADTLQKIDDCLRFWVCL